jgi:hypothetical protein
VIPETDYLIGFDAYDATVEANPDQLVHTLATELNATVVVAASRGRWSQRWEFHRGPGQAIAFVSYTETRPDEPFVESKSHAEEVSDILRRRFPRHRIARIDARIDFTDELYWFVLEHQLRQYAHRRDEFMEPAGPHEQPHLGGRTWYLGNRRSKPQRLLRLYEKGCELGLRTRGPIRLEVQIRPPSKQKAHYATLSPQQVLMDHPFVRHLAAELGLDLEHATRAKVDVVRSDLDRTLDTLARQYLSALKLCRERFDTMAELVADLELRVEQDRRVREVARDSRCVT